MIWDQLTAKKTTLDALRPLPEAALSNLEEWMAVELTYTSNALEGNTLTRMETAQILEKDITIGGKSLNEHLEAVNHARAYHFVVESARQQISTVTEHHIQHIHQHILKGIDDANAGRYRTVPVRIAGATVVLPNPAKVPELMKQFAEWLAACPHGHPVEDALKAHLDLVTIHPFVDGNGRTARLLMNLMLMMAGYPPAIIAPERRIDYLNALEKAQTGGGTEEYFRFMAAAVEASLELYIAAAEGSV